MISFEHSLTLLFPVSYFFFYLSPVYPLLPPPPFCTSEGMSARRVGGVCPVTHCSRALRGSHYSVPRNCVYRLLFFRFSNSFELGSSVARSAGRRSLSSFSLFFALPSETLKADVFRIEEKTFVSLGASASFVSCVRLILCSVFVRPQAQGISHINEEHCR